MLTDADLAMMRSAQEALLPDTCTVRRVMLADDGYGGQAETWGDVASYACRLSPIASPKELLLAGHPAQVADWMVTLPHDADCKAADHIIIGTRTLEVVGVVQGQSWQTALRVIAKEVG